jgi:hypothetical protein
MSPGRTRIVITLKQGERRCKSTGAMCGADGSDDERAGVEALVHGPVCVGVSE